MEDRTISSAVDHNIDDTKKIVDSSNECQSNDEDNEWMDILGSGQLKKKILVEGHGDRPHRGNICHLNYEATLENGTVVEKQDNVEVQLGDAEVIQGLDLAVPLMNVGEKAEVEVHARFAYGKLGKHPEIPPSSNLYYTVELLSTEPEPELEELSIAQRKIIGNRKRERGNWWYTRDEHSLAIQCYRKALEFLDEAEGGISYDSGTNTSISEELKELLEDRLKVFNNLAAAQMKIKAYDTALQSVDNVLKCQPENVKALFRKGKILSEKGETELASEVLRTAIKLEPENKVIHQELAKVLTKSKKDKNEEKSLYRRMLGQEDANDNSNSQVQQPSRLRMSWGLIAGSIAALAAGVGVYYRLKPF